MPRSSLASRFRSTFVAALIVIVAPPAAAFAQTDASPHLTIGLKLLHDRNYNGALTELETAYKEKPAAAALLGIAEASHALHDDARAAEALKTALARFGANMTSAQRSAVESELASVSASLPPPAPARIAPPPEAAGPVVEGAPLPPPMMIEQRRSVPMMITGISLTGAGVIAGAIGLGIAYAADHGNLGQCGDHTCDPATQRAVGWITVAGGAAAIGVGVPLLIVGARRVTIAPGAPSANMGASLAATF